MGLPETVGRGGMTVNDGHFSEFGHCMYSGCVDVGNHFSDLGFVKPNSDIGEMATHIMRFFGHGNTMLSECLPKSFTGFGGGYPNIHNSISFFLRITNHNPYFFESQAHA